MFPTNVRYSALGVELQLAVAAFGGHGSRSIATYLISRTGNNLLPGFYLIVAALITLVFVSDHEGDLQGSPFGKFRGRLIAPALRERVAVVTGAASGMGKMPRIALDLSARPVRPDPRRGPRRPGPGRDVLPAR